ncbi:MAG: potassium channel family protein [Acidimicrobiia bacterium]|nr:potassium channel family protein [Acidimicrobiia bacterium]
MTDQHYDQPRPNQGDTVYRVLAASAAMLLATGTVLFRLLEDWSWVDSFYFSAIAVTTVGFGDLTPTTDAGKLVTVAYIFSGIAIVTAFVDARLKRHQRWAPRIRRSRG